MKAGWRSEPLKAICQLVNRGIAPVYTESGGVAILNQKCVRDHIVNFELGRRHNLAVKKVAADRFLQIGDVLVNSTGVGTLGRVAQLRSAPIEPTTVDSHVTIVRPEAGLFYPDFFGYALIAIEALIQESGEGCGGQTELARSKLANDFHIRFPKDIQEQRRIVAILDQAFAAIATARAHTEQNLRNARELFESQLAVVFSQRGAGWVEQPLGEVAEVQSGGTPTVSRKEFWEGDIPWYSSGELNRTFTTRPERHITKTGLANSNAKLFPAGALLVGMYDTAALKMSILDRAGAFNQAIAGIKPNNRIDVEFILHAIQVKKPKLLLERRGVRQKNLSLGKIKEISVPFPTIETQRNIVRQLREITAQTQLLESLAQRKLAALDELKQSLLQRAFGGQL